MCKVLTPKLGVCEYVVNACRLHKLGYVLLIPVKINLFVLRGTCVDAVNERVAEDVVILDERFEVVAKVPKVSVLKYAFLEVSAVLVNKLA